MMKLALGILLKDGKILIGKRKSPYMNRVEWDFPGGVIREGESPRIALKSNFERQTGVATRIKRHVVNHTPIEDHNLTIFYYFLEYEYGLPMARDEMEELRWIKPQDISKVFTHVLNNKIVLELDRLKTE